MARHAIDFALDLARMPALARTSVAPVVPPDVVELMRIAAGHPQACQTAAQETGEQAPVLVAAARFYLQQTLFRPEADCYRILGINPATPRATARSHMRWLLQWLHPDRNNTWDAVYAERVLKAWHEVSASQQPPVTLNGTRTAPSQNGRRAAAAIRLPWIEQPIRHPHGRNRGSYRTLFLWIMPTGLAFVFLALWTAAYYFAPEHLR